MKIKFKKMMILLLIGFKKWHCTSYFQLELPFVLICFMQVNLPQEFHMTNFKFNQMHLLIMRWIYAWAIDSIYNFQLLP